MLLLKGSISPVIKGSIGTMPGYRQTVSITPNADQYFLMNISCSLCGYFQAQGFMLLQELQGLESTVVDSDPWFIKEYSRWGGL